MSKIIKLSKFFFKNFNDDYYADGRTDFLHAENAAF